MGEIRPLSDTQLRSIVAQAEPVILVTECEPIDEPGPRIVYVNEAFTAVTGYTAEEALGRSPRFLQCEATEPIARARIRSALEACEPVHVEITNARAGGAQFVAEMIISPAYDKSGQCTHFVSVQKDVTVRRNLAAVASQLAMEPPDLAATLSAVARAREGDAEWLAQALAEDVGAAPEMVGADVELSPYREGAGRSADLGDVAELLAEAEATVLERFDALEEPGEAGAIPPTLDLLTDDIAGAVGLPVAVSWDPELRLDEATRAAIDEASRSVIMAATMAGAASGIGVTAGTDPPTVTIRMSGVVEGTAAASALSAVLDGAVTRLRSQGIDTAVEHEAAVVLVRIRVGEG